VINVVIESQRDLPTISVRCDGAVSVEEMRAAWEEVLSGMLQYHIREAIRIECAKRGFDPLEVAPDPPDLN